MTVRTSIVVRSLVLAITIVGCHRPVSLPLRSVDDASLASLPAQAWADFIVRTGSNEQSTSTVAIFAGQLTSSSAVARKRALVALGAAGPASQPYVLDIVRRLGDDDTDVRAEAAFAIDASRARSPDLIAALLN